MIRVTVELDQYGLGKNIKKLAEVVIANDGKGTNTRGSYDVASLRRGTSIIQRAGRVENHPRLTEHVLTLVRKALESMRY